MIFWKVQSFLVFGTMWMGTSESMNDDVRTLTDPVCFMIKRSNSFRFFIQYHVFFKVTYSSLNFFIRTILLSFCFLLPNKLCILIYKNCTYDKGIQLTTSRLAFTYGTFVILLLRI